MQKDQRVSKNWGRGIQKICDACKKLGAEEPEYIVHGEDIMVKFRALQNARVTEKVTERVTEKILTILSESDRKILQILSENPSATYMEMADKLKLSRKTVSQKIKILKDNGIIVRIGSAKKGYWKIIYDKS